MNCIIITRPTLVWQDTKFAVFFLSPVTDISATVAPIGVKFRMMVHISPADRFSPFGGGAPMASPKSEMWA